MNTMEYGGYTAKIQYDSEDEIFVGDIIGLRRATIHFDANSVQGLKDRMKEMVDFYLESCLRNGVDPERPAKRKMSHRPQTVKENTREI